MMHNEMFIMFLIFSLFRNGIFSVPVCEHNLQNTLNTSRCSPLQVSSAREITSPALKDTRELLPGVEYWTDAILEVTPWIRFAGCFETTKPQNVLEISGTRLSDNHTITECLTYVKNSTFYLLGSRCLDQKSIGTLQDRYCVGNPCNFSSLCFTGRRNCVCKYDVVAMPTEPGLPNCKSVSFTFSGDDSNTLNTTLHNVYCDSKLPFFCRPIGRDYFRKKVDRQIKFWKELYNISIATQVCSLQHFHIGMSTFELHNMSDDFRNHFINNSRSYWTSIFRGKRFISRGDQHASDHNTSSCLSMMLDHNQTMVWNVRNCPLVLSNDNMDCTQVENTIDDSSNVECDFNSKSNQYQYFWFLSVPGVAVMVIVGCIGRRQCSKKKSGYSRTESSSIHYTAQHVRGAGEHTMDAEYHHTTETRPTQVDVMTTQADVMTSNRETTPILPNKQEEPHYMIMKPPEESIYISIHPRYPTNSQINDFQK